MNKQYIKKIKYWIDYNKKQITFHESKINFYKNENKDLELELFKITATDRDIKKKKIQEDLHNLIASTKSRF